MLTRRELMRAAGQAALVAAAARHTTMTAQPARVFCLFSKHLPELGWRLQFTPEHGDGLKRTTSASFNLDRTCEPSP